LGVSIDESAYAANLEAFARNYFRDLYARLETPCLVFDNCQDMDAADPPMGCCASPSTSCRICRRAFECEPLSDGLCRRLMSALAQAGRGAEGIEVFQAFCTTLQALQQGEPSAATLDLYKKILADFRKMQADRIEP
jgi:hypothetical protein